MRKVLSKVEDIKMLKKGQGTEMALFFSYIKTYFSDEKGHLT